MTVSPTASTTGRNQNLCRFGMYLPGADRQASNTPNGGAKENHGQPCLAFLHVICLAVPNAVHKAGAADAWTRQRTLSSSVAVLEESKRYACEMLHRGVQGSTQRGVLDNAWPTESEH